MSASIVLEDESCVRSFDQIGLCNGHIVVAIQPIYSSVEFHGLSGVLLNAAMSALSDLNESESDIAPYQPSPFYHFNNERKRNASSKQLTPVDRGEDLQNMPLSPLAQALRAVDVIFVVDWWCDRPATSVQCQRAECTLHTPRRGD